MDNQKALDDIATIVTNWQAARAKEIEWRTAKEELAELIITKLGGAGIGTIDGNPVLSYGMVKKTKLDQALLKEKHPDVFAECCVVKEESTGLRIK